MAFERTKNISTNLGSFIDFQVDTIVKQRTIANLEDEARFNNAVLEDNLDLDQQLQYRQEQLKRVDKGDLTEKRRIKSEIAGLKDRMEQKQYDDEYIVELTKLNSGIQSIESTIKWAEGRLANTTDQTIRKSLINKISELKSNKYTQQKDVLDKQTTFATNDKTDEVLTKQIDNVKNARVEALNAGNDDYVALLDLQLQQLNKAKSEAAISRKLINASVSSATGQTALGMLNYFNNQTELADTTTPVTIGETRYDSEQQFWSLKRAEYLNDRSTNGFFETYKGELKEKVDDKSTKGLLNLNTLKDVNGWYDYIVNRPELKDYKDRIDLDKQNSLSTTAESIATMALNQYKIDYDVNKTLSTLATIQDVYGVDQKLNYQKVILETSQTRETQVQQTLDTMNSILQGNPGMSVQDALQQAIKSGAGVAYSPEEMATQGVSGIITNAGTKAEEQQFGGKDITTPASGNITPFKQVNYQEGGLYRNQNENLVYKYENGQLRALTGDWNEEMLKKATGKGYSAVEVLGNIGTAPKGAEIKATDYSIPAPTANTLQQGQVSGATTIKTNYPLSSKGYGSIVDYLKRAGKDASFTTRMKLYKETGLGEEKDYKGDAEQNIKLLKAFE
jgi:hypothetical protein